MRYKLVILGVSILATIGVASTSSLVHAAAEPARDFSLQVTPSPLVTTVKPGQATDLELKVHNGGSTTEELKIAPRSFALDNTSGQVSLRDTTPPEIAEWISFSSPTFTAKPGEWFTEKVHIALPKDTGFSYSFALVISRKNDPKPTTDSGRLIKGSIAVFSLVNVDRPGATRKLEVEKFTTNAGIYEYLPVNMSIKFKNVGNTIVQPYGNIYIQRGGNDKTPISTLAVNDKRGYILPGSVRTLNTDWDSGFPTYKTTTAADGTQKTDLVWDWSKLFNFRIGRYTAKVVAVYNDGQRDVPIEQQVSFWVIPWKIILGFLVIILILGFGIWSLVRKAISLTSSFKRRDLKKNPKA